MVNASSCSIELWVHLGGLLNSQKLEVLVDVTGVLNGNMKYTRTIKFDQGNLLAMLKLLFIIV